VITSIFDSGAHSLYSTSESRAAAISAFSRCGSQLKKVDDKEVRQSRVKRMLLVELVLLVDLA